MKQQKLFASGGECWDDHDYPHEAHARHTDPVTSHKAAASVTNLGMTRQLILDVLKKHGPQTDEALIVLYRNEVFKDDLWKSYKMATESGIRTRRSELVRLGLVKQRWLGKTKTGRQAIVWGLV